MISPKMEATRKNPNAHRTQIRANNPFDSKELMILENKKIF